MTELTRRSDAKNARGATLSVYIDNNLVTNRPELYMEYVQAMDETLKELNNKLTNLDSVSTSFESMVSAANKIVGEKETPSLLDAIENVEIVPTNPTVAENIDVVDEFKNNPLDNWPEEPSKDIKPIKVTNTNY